METTVYNTKEEKKPNRHEKAEGSGISKNNTELL